MMPLLVIFQIPAASHIPRLGFKRFVYAGLGHARHVHLRHGAGAAGRLVPQGRDAAGAHADAAVLLQSLARHLQLRLAAVDYRPGAGRVARQIPRPRCRRPEPAPASSPSSSPPPAWAATRALAVRHPLRLQRHHGRRQPHLPQTHSRRRNARGNPRLQGPRALAGDAALPARSRSCLRRWSATPSPTAA